MLTKNPAISVIIPVYNQEKYVGKCIRSVLSQSFQDFEVIIVNDGSTDKSLKICQKYGKKDGRISIVNKENEGLAWARRDGFLKSKGNYIFFLDSDDYLAKVALATLFKIGAENAVDLIIGNYDRVWDNWGFVKKKPIPYYDADRLIAQHEVMPFMMRSDKQNGSAAYVVWGRLFKRDVIQKAMADDVFLFPPKNNRIEDLFFSLAISPYLKTIWLTNQTILHYRYGGYTTFRRNDKLQFFDAYFDKKYECCLKYGCEESLVGVLSQYVLELRDELIILTNNDTISDSDRRMIIQNELTERKIVLWARDHLSELSEEMRQTPLVHAVLNKEVDVIMEKANERLAFLRKHYYWKMKIAKTYQTIVDSITIMLISHR